MAKTLIFRLTRHQAGEDQMEALHRVAHTLYPDTTEVVIAQHSETVSSAADVVRLANGAQQEVGADHLIIEAVLPINLLSELLRAANAPIIRAVMNRKVHPDGSATFEFSHYERVVLVDVVTEPLK